jgi:hypothetical protein
MNRRIRHNQQNLALLLNAVIASVVAISGAIFASYAMIYAAAGIGVVVVACALFKLGFSSHLNRIEDEDIQFIQSNLKELNDPSITQ